MMHLCIINCVERRQQFYSLNVFKKMSHFTTNKCRLTSTFRPPSLEFISCDAKRKDRLVKVSSAVISRSCSYFYFQFRQIPHYSASHFSRSKPLSFFRTHPLLTNVSVHSFWIFSSLKSVLCHLAHRNFVIPGWSTLVSQTIIIIQECL